MIRIDSKKLTEEDEISIKIKQILIPVIEFKVDKTPLKDNIIDPFVACETLNKKYNINCKVQQVYDIILDICKEKGYFIDLTSCTLSVSSLPF